MNYEADSSDNTESKLISNNWETACLADFAIEFISGGTPSTKESDFWDGEIPWTTSAPISENDVLLCKAQRFITQRGLKSSASNIVPKGNLIVGTRVGVGKAVTNTIDMAISQDLTGVVLNYEKVQPEYISYYFKTQAVQQFFNGRKRGTTIKGISRFDLQSLAINLPPLHEQRAIARALRAVQAAREARLREIALERERKAALMEHLFTHGTRSEPTKMTDIGEMPESWSISSLGDLLRERLRNGHSACASNSNNGVRTLTLTAVTKNDFSVKNTKMTVADRLRVQDLWIEPGDIFIERANTPEFVGLASLYEGPREFAIFPDLMVRVRLREDEVDPKFLVEFLLTDQCRNYFRRNASSTTGNMPKIDHGIIERTKIPLTKDLSEQHKIAKTLRDCDAKIAALEQEAHLHDELFRAMLEELMTGRLRAGALATP